MLKINTADALFPIYNQINDSSPAKNLSLSDMALMVLEPIVGPKEAAPAITPYLAQGKTKVCALDAMYHGLIVDHDHDNMTADGIKAIYDPYGISYLAFTTSSHQQPGKGNRWKVIIPLASPADHDRWLEIAAGASLMMQTDIAQARTCQVFFAPNILETSSPYEYINRTDRPFVDLADTDHPFVYGCYNAYQTEQARLDQIAVNATPMPRVNVNINGSGTIIEQVNQAFSLSDVLIGNGYIQRGKRYLAPGSGSGIPGVVILPGGRCYSHHGAGDPLSNLNNGGHSLDSFDCICILDYGGDVTRAIKELAPQVDPEGQKDRQREYMQKQARLKAEFQDIPDLKEDAVFDISNFSMKGRSTSMELKMLDDKFVLGKLAIMGQSTIFYAPPNAGKTLLIIYLIQEAIKSGDINANDVFYINADDTYKGLIQKLKIAEEYDFHMLAPGHAGVNGGPVFKSEFLTTYLEKMIKNKTASGKILILDTVKKFTDLMSKEKSSKFAEIIRQFITHGGTVIMLAHVNKHRDENKKVIYSGTADLVDDSDCAYTLDKVQDDPNGTRTVKFENFKLRGDVALEAFYQYDYAQGTTYFDRLASVTNLDAEDQKRVEQQHQLDIILKRNQDGVDAIIESIQEGTNKKTSLITEAMAKSDISRTKIKRILDNHTGTDRKQNQFWFIEIGEKNTKTYQLNYGVFDSKTPESL